MKHLRSRLNRDEQGLAIVFIALAIVTMLAMAALVLDGGQAYATRRQMQNAADSAAAGAARALDKARFSGGDASAVSSTAMSIVAANGGDSAGGSYSCTVIDRNKAAIAPCSSTDIVTGWRAPSNIVRAVGVKVLTGNTRSTVLGPVVGINSLTARATAAASIQSLMQADGPFMVCGNAAKGAESPGGAGHELLVPDSTQTPPWRINPAAVGFTYAIHGPQVSDCGAQGNSFKGLADGPFTLPAWVDTTTGVHAGPTRSLVTDANGCVGTDTDDCIMIVPLCVDARGQSSSDMEMFCVHLGAFLVHQTGANTHTGVFLSGATAVGGQTGSSDPNANSVRIVKLLE